MSRAAPDTEPPVVATLLATEYPVPLLVNFHEEIVEPRVGKTLKPLPEPVNVVVVLTVS